MEWVCVYLTLVKNLPVLGVGAEDYKTEEACINANAATNDTFWCVTRNWLDEGQRKPVSGNFGPGRHVCRDLADGATQRVRTQS